MSFEPTTPRPSLPESLGVSLWDALADAHAKARVIRAEVEQGIDRAAILRMNCAGTDRAIPEKEGGKISGVQPLAENFRAEFPGITTSTVSSARDVAEQPQPRESRSNVIPFPSRQRGSKAETLQGAVTVLAVLEPIWRDRTETATRLRAQCTSGGLCCTTHPAGRWSSGEVG